MTAESPRVFVCIIGIKKRVYQFTPIICFNCVFVSQIPHFRRKVNAYSALKL